LKLLAALKVNISCYELLKEDPVTCSLTDCSNLDIWKYPESCRKRECKAFRLSTWSERHCSTGARRL